LSHPKPNIGFIGAGALANALTSGLSAAGYTVVAVASRSFSSAGRLAERLPACVPFTDNQEVVDRSDVIFITTPDSVIARVAGEITWHTGQSVVHCSGADTARLLTAASYMGAMTGVFHPLQTFAQPAAGIFNGVTFSIEAEEPLLSVLKTMAEALGGRWMELKPDDKPLYHASAVIAGNYLITLAKMATDLWEDFGVSKEVALAALLPLIKGTVNNLETKGIPDALTGPIARGDIDTIAKHTLALKASHTTLLPAYRKMGRQTIPIALQKGGINADKAAEIESILRD